MEFDKILLILDVDETLIYATKQALNRPSDFTVFDYHVYKRPFLTEFLLGLSAHFHLAIWSSASDDYVQKIVDTIKPESVDFHFVWGRSKATLQSLLSDEDYGRYQDEISHYFYVKNLQKIKKQGFSLEKTLILDDTPSKSKNNYGNVIYPDGYEGALDDKELPLLLTYLLTLKDVENVRKIEKRFWRQAVLT